MNLSQESDKDKNSKRKCHWGQMLNKQGGDLPSHRKAKRESVPKQFPATGKKKKKILDI